jgi:hypothetical protein
MTMSAVVTEKEHLPFLVLGDYHLSAKKARIAVIELMARAQQDCPDSGWERAQVTIKKGDQEVVTMTFPQMVEEAERTGIVHHFHRFFDRADSVFGGTHDGDFGTPNYNMKISTTYGGFSAEVQGPCRTAVVEFDLTLDILYYRMMACRHSNEHDFRPTSRYFRNYLSACVSIVDAFVNRHIHVAKTDGFDSPEFNDLQLSRRVEDRLELFWNVICSEDPAILFGSRYWCHFNEIRQKRNEIVHSLNPIAIYSLPEIQKYLNKVHAVGELLLLLRTAHKKPTVGFIEQLRTAPKVKYQQIRFKVDGDVVDRVDEG